MLDFILMMARRAAVFLSGIIFTKLTASGLLSPDVPITSDMIEQAVLAIVLLIVSIGWSILKKFLEKKDTTIWEAIKNVLAKPTA
jgi:hypothetical protein